MEPQAPALKVGIPIFNVLPIESGLRGITFDSRTCSPVLQLTSQPPGRPGWEEGGRNCNRILQHGCVPACRRLARERERTRRPSPGRHTDHRPRTWDAVTADRGAF